MTETDISAEIVFTLIATLHYSRYSFTKSHTYYNVSAQEEYKDRLIIILTLSLVRRKMMTYPLAEM